MKVTTRFGEIEIDDKACIHLEDGLVGFPEARRFCLVGRREESPFHWLQSLDEPTLALAVISPMDFCEDYSFDLQESDAERLELQSAADAVVLTTVTVDHDNRCVTTNLLGPIIVNTRTLSARQVVLSNENFSTKHLLFELRTADTPVEETGQEQAGECEEPFLAKAA